MKPKLKREWRPAFTEWFLVATVRDERVEGYNGCIYHSQAAAQRDADRMNARRDIAKRGPVTVESRERDGAYVTTVRIQI